MGMIEEETYERCKVRWLTDEECARCISWDIKLGKDIFDQEKRDDGYMYCTKDPPLKS